MHLKVFVKLKKTLKTLSSGQKNPKKTQKTKKKPKNPKKNPGLVFFLKKPGFFSNPVKKSQKLWKSRFFFTFAFWWKDLDPYKIITTSDPGGPKTWIRIQNLMCCTWAQPRHMKNRVNRQTFRLILKTKKLFHQIQTINLSKAMKLILKKKFD